MMESMDWGTCMVVAINAQHDVAYWNHEPFCLMLLGFNQLNWTPKIQSRHLRGVGAFFDPNSPIRLPICLSCFEVWVLFRRREVLKESNVEGWSLTKGETCWGSGSGVEAGVLVGSEAGWALALCQMEVEVAQAGQMTRWRIPFDSLGPMESACVSCQIEHFPQETVSVLSRAPVVRQNQFSLKTSPSLPSPNSTEAPRHLMNPQRALAAPGFNFGIEPIHGRKGASGNESNHPCHFVSSDSYFETNPSEVECNGSSF